MRRMMPAKTLRYLIIAALIGVTAESRRGGHV